MNLMTRGNQTRRLGITLLAIVFVLSLFAGRLVQLQGMESGNYRKLALHERDKTIPLPAMRGSITGANGQILAMTVATYLVWADPTQIPAAKLQSAAGALADPLGMTQAAVLNLLQHPTSPGYVVLAKGVPAQASGQITAMRLPGIRQTRWIKGRQQLTVADVRAETRFPDAIARTAWPIELHDRPEGYIWEPFADDHLHYVPVGSLVPAEADNIVAVGRCIDGDSAALSSVRVMGPCIAMGAAAAHALDLAGSGSVQQIDIAALRTRVCDNLDSP
jgi:hypothetical protein